MHVHQFWWVWPLRFWSYGSFLFAFKRATYIISHSHFCIISHRNFALYPIVIFVLYPIVMFCIISHSHFCIISHSRFLHIISQSFSHLSNEKFALLFIRREWKGKEEEERVEEGEREREGDGSVRQSNQRSGYCKHFINRSLLHIHKFDMIKKE